VGKFSNIDKTTNSLLSRYDKLKGLADLAGRKDYPGKVKRIQKKIVEEVELWSRKGPSAKLNDLNKDLKFIESQTDYDNLDKDQIDLLATKYSIGYGEVKRSSY